MAWNKVSDLPAGRIEACGVKVNNRIYIAGGHTSWSAPADNLVSTVLMAKVNTNGTLEPWVSAGDDVSVGRNAVMLTHNNRILIVGGTGALDAGLASIKVASIKPNGGLEAWASYTLPKALTNHAAFIVGNQLVVLGGETVDYGGSTNTVIYQGTINSNGSVDNWRNRGAIPYNRIPRSCVFLNGIIWVLYDRFNLAWARFNVNGAETLQTPDWATADFTDVDEGSDLDLTFHALTSHGKNLYVVGGMDTGTSDLNPRTQIFPTNTPFIPNNVLRTQALPELRTAGVLIKEDNQIWWISGDDSTDPMSDVYFTTIETNGTIGNISETAYVPYEAPEEVDIFTPDGRVHHNMAYDAARGKVILFGGTDADGTFYDDTWEWDTTTGLWTELSPASSPDARAYHGMAYDIVNDQIVLFGGGAGGEDFDDTWVWDGEDWTELTPDDSPAARQPKGMMAWDVSRQRVVLFGGYSEDDGGGLNDVWEWSGTNWIDRTPSEGDEPPLLDDGLWTFDPATGKMLLYGGYSSSLVDGSQQTWTWEGETQTWTQLSPSTTPTTSYMVGGVRDSRGVILFGGRSPSSASALGKTWRWNGTNWSDQGTVTDLEARKCARLVWDSGLNKARLFGGGTEALVAGTLYTDFWSWSNLTWSENT